MNNFCDLSQEEVFDVNAGGVISAVAGGIAGAMIGTMGALVPAVIYRDSNIVVKAAITGGTVGVWAGVGFPLP